MKYFARSKTALRICAAFIASVLAAGMLWSCSDADGCPDAVAVKPTGAEGWCMLLRDGSIKDEVNFSRCPTEAVEGRFWVPDSGGCWKLYDLSSLQPVNDKAYRYVSHFSDGRALVAERDSGVTVIDRRGNTMLSLDTIAGETVVEFTAPVDGLTVFCTQRGYMGVVDLKGNVVLPAVFTDPGAPSCGRIVAHGVDLQRGREADSVDPAKTETVITVIYDYRGRKVFELNSAAYQVVADSYKGGYLPVAKQDADNAPAWGLLDVSGREVLAPDSAFSSIDDVASGTFVFHNAEGQCGLGRVADGAILIKPRYAEITYVGPRHIAVVDGGGAEAPCHRIISLIDLAADGPEFASIGQEMWGKVVVAGENYGLRLFDLRGFFDTLLPDLEAVGTVGIAPCDVIKSDFVDLDAMLRELDVKATGVCGIDFSTGVTDALARQMGKEKPMAANFAFTDEVNLFPVAAGEMVAVTVVYPEKLSYVAHRHEQVADPIWGPFNLTVDRVVPTGFRFTDAKPVALSVTFNNYGRLFGKLGSVYNLLADRMAGEGHVIGRNDAATLVELPSGRKVLVALEPHSVKVEWGAQSPDGTVIHHFAGNKESLDSDDAE